MEQKPYSLNGGFVIFAAFAFLMAIKIKKLIVSDKKKSYLIEKSRRFAIIDLWHTNYTMYIKSIVFCEWKIAEKENYEISEERRKCKNAKMHVLMHKYREFACVWIKSSFAIK